MSTYAPPPPRGDGSCWKWGAIACLGMGCLGIIIVGALTAFLVTRPGFKRIVKTTQQAGFEVERMQSVGKAIQKYALDKGKYPSKLADLVPNYVSPDLLKSTTDPDGKRLVYKRPPADAPDSFHILEVSVPNPVSPMQAPPIRYFWTKGGKVGTPSPFEIPSDAASPGATSGGADAGVKTEE